MSCEDCREMQDSTRNTYFRWGTANVQIRGCDRHLLEIFEVLRKAQEAK